MKRILPSILILIYFVVNTGFTVNLHYCMDEYYSWELGESDKECERCGMDTTKSDSCCRDEVQVLKLQQDQSFSGIVQYSFSLAHLLPGPLSFITLHHNPLNSIAKFAVHDPPINTEEDIYIQNQVFRI